jgi:phage baseplate assembly protein W
MAQIIRTPDYSDLDLDFIAHPTTKDIVTKKGPDAIKRSVRNLILTNYYDRPFRSNIGSNVQNLLFENPNPLIAVFIKDAVKEVIQNFEPRVKLVEIAVTYDEDNNGYSVSLAYIILNRNVPITQNIFLERLR